MYMICACVHIYPSLHTQNACEKGLACIDLYMHACIGGDFVVGVFIRGLTCSHTYIHTYISIRNRFLVRRVCGGFSHCDDEIACHGAGSVHACNKLERAVAPT
jgi:hypothetical protein